MNCPRCRTKLTPLRTDLGQVLMCMTCFGHVSSVRFLSRLITQPVWDQLLLLSTSVAQKHFSCPKCNSTTQTRRFHFPDHFADLDLCVPCSLLWFDKNELEEFPVRIRASLAEPHLPDNLQRILPDGSLAPIVPIDPDAKAQLLLARLKLDQMARHSRNRARYWSLQRIVNSPWMINAVSQHLTDYSDFEDI